MSKKQFCPSCGEGTNSDWRVCGYCNYLLIEKATICDQCHQVISGEDLKYCPYCRFELRGSKVITPAQNDKSKVDEKESMEVIDYSIVNFDVWKKMIRFDVSSMRQISGSKTRISNFSSTFILLIGLSVALTNMVRQLLFTEDVSSLIMVQDFALLALVVPISLFTIAYFIERTMFFVGKSSKTGNWINLLSSYLPLFILKDILVVLIMSYVRIFGGTSEDYLANSTYEIFFYLMYVYIFFQFLVLLKNEADISGFVSFILVGFIYFWAGVFSGIYVYSLLELILEVLVWIV